MSKLTPKQARFIEEYLVDLNATDSAKRAGYSPRGAEVTGFRLLREPKISRALQDRMNERSERTEITSDMVLKGIMSNIQRCEQGEPVYDRSGAPVMTETPDGSLAPMWKYDPANVLKGYELLGKHLKLFTDKHEHSGVDGEPIQTITRRIVKSDE